MGVNGGIVTGCYHTNVSPSLNNPRRGLFTTSGFLSNVINFWVRSRYISEKIPNRFYHYGENSQVTYYPIFCSRASTDSNRSASGIGTVDDYGIYQSSTTLGSMHNITNMDIIIMILV